jgi:predicted RNA-binding protein YlxR (DUF448 family)
MNLRPDHIGTEDQCIRIYNPLKQEVIKVYNTYSQASRGLGISEDIIKNAAITKKRKFSRVLNMEVAIRVNTKTEADMKMIKQINK